MRILVAEDDAAVRGLLREILEAEGYDVAAAANGQEALLRAAEHTPDLILMDLSMPILDGWNARALLERGRSTARIPVILVSAHIGTDERQQIIHKGFSGVVRKPFTRAELLAEIDRVLGLGQDSTPGTPPPAT